jgi:hypothetical protein
MMRKSFVRTGLLSAVGLALFAAGFNVSSRPAARAFAQGNTSPRIVEVEVKGKKLFVKGENFDQGAVILVNGVAQKTRNDADAPSTSLIAKKAAKKMARGEVAVIQVQNTAGARSEDFDFFPGPVVTLVDSGKALRLRVGERFLLLLKRENYTWTPNVENSSIIKQVSDARQPQGSQGVFEAQAPGQTTLIAVGELPCHRAQPACMAPSLQFEVNVVVE